MQVWFFQDALAEIEESRAWYRARSHAAEAAFLHEVDHAVSSVEDAPHRWPCYLNETRRYVFETFPYSLIYFTEGDVLNIVAVAHDRRRPGYWRKRLKRANRHA